MADRGSITHWIGGLRSGDSQAVEQIWQRYFERLVAFARQRLQHSSKRVSDEDDVVIQAFDSFFRGAKSDRFPQLNDRDDLWQVLLMLARRKATNQIVFENRLKRGGGKVRGESVFGHLPVSDQAGCCSHEPTPELAAEVAEQCELRLKSLNDPLLEKVAMMKLEGFSNQEIAAAINRKERTVQRKLRTIKELWTLDEE